MAEEEQAMAAVPKGLKALCAHLMAMGEQQNSLVRMDDWHMNMALGILENPQEHMDVLAKAGFKVPKVPKSEKVNATD